MIKKKELLLFCIYIRLFINVEAFSAAGLCSLNLLVITGLYICVYTLKKRTLNTKTVGIIFIPSNFPSIFQLKKRKDVNALLIIIFEWPIIKLFFKVYRFSSFFFCLFHFNLIPLFFDLCLFLHDFLDFRRRAVFADWTYIATRVTR